MRERKFVILRYAGKTPAMAMCDYCGLKFFAPTPLSNDPQSAEENLRYKYALHHCKGPASFQIRPAHKN